MGSSLVAIMIVLHLPAFSQDHDAVMAAGPPLRSL
jgi:hypothetical protein